MCILFLQIQLEEKEQTCKLAEEELLRVRREAQDGIQENRNLQSKLYLAEQAQTAARYMENDYEEVVQLLENEIGKLRLSQSRDLVSQILCTGKLWGKHI